uniref:Magnesium transporter NIPA8 n=1 Tax=Hirondellea gigas TaxID=1518452 RepID=A0A6A7GE37_9CRUS
MSLQEDEVASFLWGAFLNVGGSISINLGTTLLKYSHNKAEEQKLRDKERLDAVLISHQWWWRIAFFIFCCGNVLNFVSFSFAAQSLLAGLGSVQFVTNVIFSYLILGSLVTPRILTATGIIVMGNVLLVLFGNHEDRDYTQRELIYLYSNTGYLVYLSLTIAAACSLHALYVVLQRKLAEGSEVTGNKRTFLPFYSKVEEKFENDDDLPAQRGRTDTYELLLPFCYAAVSGLIGTLSVMLAKSISELLRVTLKDPANDNQFLYPFPYAVLFGLIMIMGFWLYRLNKALRLFDAIFIVPVMQVIWIVFSVLSGGIYFQEFVKFDLLQFVMFFSGILLVMIGVTGLSPDKDKDQKGWQRETESVTRPSRDPRSPLKAENKMSFWDGNSDVDLLKLTRSRTRSDSSCVLAAPFSSRFHL